MLSSSKGYMDQNPLDKFKKLHEIYLYSAYKISDLAKYLGVSRRTIERWLSGKYHPSEDKIKKISEYLSHNIH